MAQADARERVVAVFPQLGARTVTKIGTGWTVDTYEVDGTWIVQFPRGDVEAERLRAQIDRLPELAAELSALVPEPEFADRDVPAMAYRKLAGVSLEEAPDGLWPERLGRFLYDLHLMPAEYVGLRGLSVGRVREWMRSELDEMRSAVFPLLDIEESERFAARFDTFLEDDELWRFAPCLTHGDIGPEHILVSPTGDLAGVLDWEDIGVDDPVADFTWLLLARPPDAERVLGAYGGAPDPAFRRRAAYRFFLMPFHEVRYGRMSDQPSFVASGIAGIRARADVVPD